MTLSEIREEFGLSKSQVNWARHLFDHGWFDWEDFRRFYLEKFPRADAGEAYEFAKWSEGGFCS